MATADGEKRRSSTPPAGRIILHVRSAGTIMRRCSRSWASVRMHVTYNDGTMEVRMPSQRHEPATQL